MDDSTRVQIVLGIIIFGGTAVGLALLGFLRLLDWQRQRRLSGGPQSGPVDPYAIAEEALELVDQVRAENTRLKAQLATQPSQAPAPSIAAELSRVELHELASALNVAIIGPKGSGKTTTMTALLALRPGYVEALDPHNEPHKWPCAVVGGGERFDLIHSHLLASYATMRVRYTLANTGERSQATYQTTSWRVTLAGDEWGGIVSEIPDQRGTKDRPPVLGAGSLLGKLIARGRKVGIGMLIAAHDDTAAQFGLGGEMGLVDCFDWLVYLGGQATGNTAIPLTVRQAAQRMTRPALALNTERHTWHLLMLDNIGRYQASSNAPALIPADFATVLHKLEAQRDSLLGALLEGGAGAPVVASGAAPVFSGAARADTVASGAEMRRESVEQPESAIAQRVAPPAPAPTSAAVDSPVISPNELRRTADAVRLVAGGASQTAAICQAFGVSKGSNPRYLRARWLYQQATVTPSDKTVEDETNEESEGAPRAVAA